MEVRVITKSFKILHTPFNEGDVVVIEATERYTHFSNSFSHSNTFYNAPEHKELVVDNSRVVYNN